MKENFPAAISFVLNWEGFVSNDPNDPGGFTKYGISEKLLDKKSIKSLTKEDAIKIYRDKFWKPIKGDQLPSGIDTFLFQLAVNVGVRRASKFLQIAANRLLGSKKLVVDGIIGPKTLFAVSSLPPESLLAELCSLQCRHYASLAIAKASYRKFLYGWLRRASHALSFSLSIRSLEKNE